MDTSMEEASSVALLAPDLSQLEEEPDQMSGLTVFPEAFSDLDPANTFLTGGRRQQQQQQQAPPGHPQTHLPRFYGHNPVPPTPNSLEMHGSQAEFYQNHADRQHQLMYEHYRRHQNEQVTLLSNTECLRGAGRLTHPPQMNFTPLVSPAVTPLDTQFRNPDYAASTDCFSPLTSPALRAQSQSAQPSLYGGVRGSDTSDTTSPVDLSHEYPAPTSGSTPGSLRKTKRTASSSSSKNPARTVRQSPLVKAQSRRKQTSSTIIPPKEVAIILEEAQKSKKSTPAAVDGRLTLPYGQDSSDPDSVSPEPLSEILMPPPATPKSNSAGRSPYLAAKDGNQQQTPSSAGTKGAPATPASLMKIRKQAGKSSAALRSTSQLKEQAARAEADLEQIMEGLPSPEATSNSRKPALKPINTVDANGGRVTATFSSARGLGTASAPATAVGVAFPSPIASTTTSPKGVTKAKITDPVKPKPRDPRKRNSSSSQISPALRPKISPSIKPLLPEGGKLMRSQRLSCSLD